MKVVSIQLLLKPSGFSESISASPNTIWPLPRKDEAPAEPGEFSEKTLTAIFSINRFFSHQIRKASRSKLPTRDPLPAGGHRHTEAAFVGDAPPPVFGPNRPRIDRRQNTFPFARLRAFVPEPVRPIARRMPSSKKRSRPRSSVRSSGCFWGFGR